MLVGYCKGDAYRVLLDQTYKVIERKDAVFEEHSSTVEDGGKECILFDDVEP